jgi:hypothetical protein
MTRSAAGKGRAVSATVMAIGVAIAMLVLSASASAANHPKGEFAQFADCPLSDASLAVCTIAKTETGKFTIAKETVPIVSTITLQGGIQIGEKGEEFVAAEDGNTLSKTPQKVPGGLAGLVKCNEISNFFERIACEVVFENGVTGVNETTELAAPANKIGINVENVITGTGIGLSLPVKVHLENPLLGSSCYIGSEAHPIVIELTSGTTSPPPPNKPIKGSPGELEIGAEGVLGTKNGSLVNNSFAAGGTEGCGGLFSFIIDPLVNAKLGLPSAAGNNTAILGGTFKVAEASKVRKSEE